MTYRRRDEAMCLNKTCPLRTNCQRHPESGREAMPYQVYADFQPNPTKPVTCDHQIKVNNDQA
jgi:hypothetical protein